VGVRWCALLARFAVSVAFGDSRLALGRELGLVGLDALTHLAARLVLAAFDGAAMLLDVRAADSAKLLEAGSGGGIGGAVMSSDRCRCCGSRGRRRDWCGRRHGLRQCRRD